MLVAVRLGPHHVGPENILLFASVDGVADAIPGPPRTMRTALTTVSCTDCAGVCLPCTQPGCNKYLVNFIQKI